MPLRLLGAGHVVLADRVGVVRVLRLLTGVVGTGVPVGVERGPRRRTGVAWGGASRLATLIGLARPRRASEQHHATYHCCRQYQRLAHRVPPTTESLPARTRTDRRGEKIAASKGPADL